MRKTIPMFLALTLLTGCSWLRRSDGAPGAEKKNYDPFTAATPAYVLPGVPLGSARPSITAAPAEAPAEAPVPAAVVQPEDAAPAAAELADVKPAAAVPAAAAPGDLDFHMAAAEKYSARKKYRSAAAEYGAALGYLPAGDARAVHLLERQGAMLLKAGAEPKAREYFRSAIKKAGELRSSGPDLADAHLGLGYCLEKEKKLPEAISNYEKAMELTGNKTVKARLSRTISDLKK